MSDTVCRSEELDRIRRMIEAGLIRLEKTESAECLIQIRLANVAIITTLIDDVRDEERRQHAETVHQVRRVRKHKNGKTCVKVPSRDTRPTEPERAATSLRDCVANWRISPSVRESGKEDRCETNGFAEMLPAGVGTDSASATTATTNGHEVTE